MIRYGDDYYLIASSFQCTPGLPILHSTDLVNWSLVGHAVENLPHARYEEFRSGCGIWAPSIRYHAGRFWVFFALPDEGIYMVSAEHPAGPYTEPFQICPGKGLIDPCPFWDEVDGEERAYLVFAYAATRAGIADRLHIRPMALDASSLLGPGEIVFCEPERQPTIEGAKMMKRNGWYYIFAPAGGVPTGWQSVLRSRNIYGPYEDRVLLAQGNTPINGPHQGALVDTPTGEWWFLHFQDAGIYGRIVHLQPAGWEGDWPWIGVNPDANGVREPVARWQKPCSRPVDLFLTPATSDDFESKTLGKQWQWNANHKEEWYSLKAHAGYLRLYCQPAPHGELAQAPHLLLQKFPARQFTVTTTVTLVPEEGRAEAGLVVMGRQHAAVCLRWLEGAFWIVYRTELGEEPLQKLTHSCVILRVHVEDGGLCRFSYRESCEEITSTSPSEEEFVTIPMTFSAREGHWIGAKVGIYAVIPEGDEGTFASNGYADFRSFLFS